MNYLPRLASNHNPPDLCLPNSWDHRGEPPAGTPELIVVFVLGMEPRALGMPVKCVTTEPHPPAHTFSFVDNGLLTSLHEVFYISEVLFYFLFFVVLGIEPRSLCMLGRSSTPELARLHA
jgi:hypothetical protein